MVEPRRCALRFKPPTLVLLYWDPSSGKQRRRSMPLRGIDRETSMESYASKLLNHPRHSPYIQTIPIQQLHSLLCKIKSASSQHPPYAEAVKQEEEEVEGYERWWEKGTQKQMDEHSLTSDPNETAVTTLEGTAASNLLAERLESSLVLQDPPLERNRSVSQERKDVEKLRPVVHTSQSPGRLSGPGTQPDQGIHNVRSVLEDQTLSHQQKGHAAMTDTLETGTTLTTPLANSDQFGMPPATFPTEIPDYSDDFCSDGKPEDERQGLGLPAEDRSLSFHVSTLRSTNEDGLQAGDSGEGDSETNGSGSLEIHGIVTGDNSAASDHNEEDLNKVPEETLAQRKEQMNVLFEAHCLNPGDKNYEYDRQQDFGPAKIESGWDSDTSSLEF